MNDRLDRLAHSHGIELAYVSELGERRLISDEAKRALLEVLGVDPDSGAAGPFNGEEEKASQRCVVPEGLTRHKAWGIACQLYGLRSSRNLGMGDFEDLARLAEIGAEAEAAFIGVNPLHALFLADPGRYSPYSPSTRRFLNPLYIAVDMLDGGPEAIAERRRQGPGAFDHRESRLVDYPAVGALKRDLLSAIFETRFDEISSDEAFKAYCAGGGEALQDFALFEALSARMMVDGHYAGWHSWPPEFQDRGSEAVEAFARENARAVLFHQWLQYEAEEQLARAQKRARGAGMRIGLYLDLAVGVAPDGAETWSDPGLVVRTARVGSPPDMFNSQGQDWGLAPLSPTRLAERDFAPLAASFDNLMRSAGAVRIDHAMGLARLWWIPEQAQSAGGGYVRYPLGRMLDVVAKASQENRCLVIGEDLGTVPPGFRPTVAEAGILSYRVLYFERHREVEFLLPEAYPELALACVSTHDLPTLRGWWQGKDIELRAETGRQDEATTQKHRDERRRDRRTLIAALKDAGVLPENLERVATGEEAVPDGLSAEISEAVHRFVARTPSLLVSAQLEDMLGSDEQPNLPGTTDAYPNWRIRSAVMLEDIAENPRFQGLAAAMRMERPETV